MFAALKRIFSQHIFFFIATLLGSFFAVALISPYLAKADFTDSDDVAAGFSGGTKTNLTWNAGNTWLEMDSTGLSTGFATFTSRIVDTGGTTIWSSVSWVPEFPYMKELPDSAGVETAYTSGNISMSSSSLLYHLNESSGNLSDTSGNNITGTVASVTYGTTGKFGTALSFGGLDSVTIANNAALDMAGGNFTAAMWAKVTSGNHLEMLVIGKTTYTTRFSLGTSTLGTGVPKIAFGLADAAGLLYGYYNAGSRLDDGLWHHLAVTRSGATIKLFVDGYSKSYSSSADAFSVPNANYLGYGDYGYYTGLMDEVAIWSKALTDTDILNLYKRGAARLKFQVQSCDDASCSGETFLGPNGSTSFYSELTTSTVGLPSKTLMNISNNRYFQYRTIFETASSTLSPYLNSVTVVGGTPSVTVTEPGSSTTSTEAGVTDTYTLVLGMAPSSNVTVAVTPDANSTVSTSSVVFTTSNWSTPVTVTVTAVDDSVAQGTHTSTITHSASSADTNYNGITVASVTNTITDNDTAGVTISEIGSSTTSTEAGVTDTYTVVLTSAPTSTVTIAVSPDSNSSVSTSSIAFTSSNWSTPVTVTVTAVNDSIAEGTHTSTITHSASSSNYNYNGITVASVTNTITDNDTAGVTISEIGGSTTSTEAGVTDTYTVVLTSAPTSTVTISVSPDSGSTVSTSSIAFTSSNYSTPVTVTVTAVNDSVAQGTHNSTISHSASSSNWNYNGITVASVTNTITDNDTAGVTITETGGTTLTEAGATDTYTVVLTSAPTSTVTVSITPDANSTVSTSSIAFTSSNYSTAVTVTVTAVNDSVAQGTHNSTITHSVSSSNWNYNGISVNSVVASVTDNDTAGVTISEPGSSTTSTEAGVTDTYTIVLTSAPTSTVTITVSPDSGSTVSTSSIAFTSSNYSTPVTVTVTAVNDSVAQGTHNSTISHSASSSNWNYNGITVASVTNTITDNDTAGVTVTQSGGTTAVTEVGATDSFTVVLTSAPTSTVTVALSLSESGQASLSTSSLQFSSANWDTAVTVTVTATDDSIAEDSHSVSISYTVSSSNWNYSGLSVTATSVSITDNDTAGITVTGGGSIAVTEGGTTDSFTVVLDSAPTSTVTIALSVTAQATLSTSSLQFSSANYSTPVTVTVTAVDDATVEGAHTATISFVVTSSNWNYNAFTLADLTANITDNDTASTSSGSDTSSVNNSSPAAPPAAPDIPQPPVGPAPVGALDVTPQAGKPVSVAVGGETHTVTQVGAATNNEITIILQSKPITLTLLRDKPKDVDSDKDGTPDLRLLYQGLEDGVPRLNIVALTSAGEEKRPISINQGAYSTNSRDVHLKFNSTGAVWVAVSENKKFVGAGYIKYVPSLNFKLSEGVGEKTVYVRFRSAAGGIADAFDTIYFEPNAKTVAPLIGPLPIQVKSTSKKPIFVSLLKVGSKGDEVIALQKVLQKFGYIPANTPLGNYGSVTRVAVVKFQKANRIDPVGYVGPGTRAVLNKIAQ